MPETQVAKALRDQKPRVHSPQAAKLEYGKLKQFIAKENRGNNKIRKI